MNRGQNPRLLILALGVVGLALALAGAVLAALANLGVQGERFDLLTQIAPAYAAAGLLGGALAAVARPTRAAGAVLALVALLAAGRLIVPELIRSTGPNAAPGASGEIKIIQFNVWRGNRNIPAIVDWLQRENPDFAFVEESSPALRDAIIRRTGWSVAGARTTSMIFSRKPYAVMHRPQASPNSGFTWVNATYETASGPVELVVTHVERPTQTRARRAIAGLAQMLSPLPRDRMILAGDFNLTPWSFALRDADARLGLVRRDRAQPTWPADGFHGLPAPAFLPIDHVYAGPSWATVDVRRGPSFGSDHYPLVVRLAPVR